jgi:hypothetical protein
MAVCALEKAGLKAETGNAQVDFLKLGQKLAAPEQLHTVYYYNVPLMQRLDPRDTRLSSAS